MIHPELDQCEATDISFDEFFETICMKSMIKIIKFGDKITRNISEASEKYTQSNGTLYKIGRLWNLERFNVVFPQSPLLQYISKHLFFWSANVRL